MANAQMLLGYLQVLCPMLSLVQWSQSLEENTPTSWTLIILCCPSLLLLAPPVFNQIFFSFCLFQMNMKAVAIQYYVQVTMSLDSAFKFLMGKKHILCFVFFFVWFGLDWFGFFFFFFFWWLRQLNTVGTFNFAN